MEVVSDTRMRGYVFVPGNAQCFASSFASVAKHRPLLESITYLERYFLSFVTNRSLDLSAVSSQASVLHQKRGRARLGFNLQKCLSYYFASGAQWSVLSCVQLRETFRLHQRT